MKNTTPDMYDRLQILQQFKHVAVVGLSADQYRPSHFVAIYLQAEGYDIIPINPRYAGQTTLGKRAYSTMRHHSSDKVFHRSKIRHAEHKMRHTKIAELYQFSNNFGRVSRNVMLLRMTHDLRRVLGNA